MIVTVDCGMTAHRVLQQARELTPRPPDVIVVDHHAPDSHTVNAVLRALRPPDLPHNQRCCAVQDGTPRLPPALAVVNPNRIDEAPVSVRRLD